MSQGNKFKVSGATVTLADLRGALLADDFVQPAAAKLGLFKERLNYLLEMSLEEAEHALLTLAPYDLNGKRILEIGSGPGILAASLRRAGFDVTTLEPGGKGIEQNKSLAWMVMDRLNVHGRHLDVPGETLDPERHGVFDFVFSHNVMEHVADLHGCLDAMFSVLAPGGEIVCHCPNYFIPYEPHYCCWLIPFFPRWSRPFLSRKHHQDDAVWESLNFITYRDVKKAARRHGCSAKFVPGLMAAAFERIGTDPTFRRRHGFFNLIYWVLKKLGLMPLLRRWPGQLSSPMTFELVKPAKDMAAGGGPHLILQTARNETMEPRTK